MIETIKKAILLKKHCIYNGVGYYITAVFLRLIDKQFKYFVELQDIKANSICSAKLSKIKILER